MLPFPANHLGGGAGGGGNRETALVRDLHLIISI